MTEGKRPPIDLKKLREENEEKVVPEPGELSYVSNGGRGEREGDRQEPIYGDEPKGRVNWTQVLLSAVLALVASIIVMFGYAASKGELETFKGSIEEIDKKVDGALQVVEKKVEDRLIKVEEDIKSAILEARSAKNSLGDYARKSDIPNASKFALKEDLPKIPNLSGYALKSDLLDGDTYASKASVDELLTKVEDLESDLEEALSSSSSEASGGTLLAGVTRWTSSAGFTSNLAVQHSELRIEVDPGRVGPEEGFYDMEIEFYNSGTTDIVNANPKVWITLTPRDYIYVDPYAPMLVTIDWPYTEWDADVSSRTRGSQEVCRRITFESETFNELPNLAPGESVNYDLELELFYD